MSSWAKSLGVFLLFFALAIPITLVHADGNESIGTPSIAIASGSGLVMAGTGMFSQPGTITVDDVPAGATVKQVLLYWQGIGAGGDNTVIVNGTEVTGALIGDSEPAYTDSAFRSDITTLDLIQAGVSNYLTITGMDFPLVNNGAGVVVIFDDGSGGTIDLRDGQDLVWLDANNLFAQTSVPQMYIFEPPLPNETTVDLRFMVGGVRAYVSGGPHPNSLQYIVNSGAPVRLDKPFTANDGADWDTLILPILLPAGTTTLEVQIFSEPSYAGLPPESLMWIAAALTIPPAPSQFDQDGDGVEDRKDKCASTPAGEPVNKKGCSPSQLDHDGDGVKDRKDKCAGTPVGKAVDKHGCSHSQLDRDDDGVKDRKDKCAGTPVGEAVDKHGCSHSQLDHDGDGKYLDDEDEEKRGRKGGD